MITFIVGFFIGAIAGAVLMGLCAAASDRGDDE